MDDYRDIINLPYIKSKTHKHMSNHDRAAQFAPFAALTGYENIILETARRTEKKAILSEDKKEELSRKISFLVKNKVTSIIKITYFVKDSKKEGGKYVTEEFTSVKLDSSKRAIIAGEKKINITDIFEIECAVFDENM